MKLVILFLATALIFTDLDKIGKINTAKAEAKKAYLSGNFKVAIEKYKYIIDSLGVNEDEVRANLASAYFQLNDTTNAINSYSQLIQTPNKRISSIANQQLGVISNTKGNLEESLNYFKQALKVAPDNEEARYNYEVVKKKLEEKKKQEQKNKDQKDQDKKDDNKDQKEQQKKESKEQEKKDKEKKDQEKKDQKDKNKDDKKDQDKKDKEQQEKEKKEQEKKEQEKKDQESKDKKDKDKKEIPPSVSDKLKEMQITEEKAKMILEAMKNQEVQYLQQNKRKATKPKEKGKPDW